LNRCPEGSGADVIGAALDLMPEGVRRSVEDADVLFADPVFVGLHDYDEVPGYPDVTYRRCAHVVYPYHQHRIPKSMRCTTVVLPTPKPLRSVLHEYGHVLDEQLGFELVLAPVSKYAMTNREEAFAEAFAAWVMRERWVIDDEPASLRLCPLALDTFERLADDS